MLSPLLLSFVLLAFLSTLSTAYIPPSAFVTYPRRATPTGTSSVTSLNIFGGDDDNQPLTRDTEPDEFFSSKMDEMSDSEKLPIALAGLAGISLPFIFGLIFLYASK